VIKSNVVSPPDVELENDITREGKTAPTLSIVVETGMKSASLGETFWMAKPLAKSGSKFGSNTASMKCRAGRLGSSSGMDC
jgi:hypothetical protein